MYDIQNRYEQPIVEIDETEPTVLDQSSDTRSSNLDLSNEFVIKSLAGYSKRSTDPTTILTNMTSAQVEVAIIRLAIKGQKAQVRVEGSDSPFVIKFEARKLPMGGGVGVIAGLTKKTSVQSEVLIACPRKNGAQAKLLVRRAVVLE
jgi:hypothetical protein